MKKSSPHTTDPHGWKPNFSRQINDRFWTNAYSHSPVFFGYVDMDTYINAGKTPNKERPYGTFRLIRNKGAIDIQHGGKVIASLNKRGVLTAVSDTPPYKLADLLPIHIYRSGRNKYRTAVLVSRSHTYPDNVLNRGTLAIAMQSLDVVKNNTTVYRRLHNSLPTVLASDVSFSDWQPGVKFSLPMSKCANPVNSEDILVQHAEELEELKALMKQHIPTLKAAAILGAFGNLSTSSWSSPTPIKKSFSSNTEFIDAMYRAVTEGDFSDKLMGHLKAVAGNASHTDFYGGRRPIDTVIKRAFISRFHSVKADLVKRHVESKKTNDKNAAQRPSES